MEIFKSKGTPGKQTEGADDELTAATVQCNEVVSYAVQVYGRNQRQ
jgi:hypothetical protein